MENAMKNGRRYHLCVNNIFRKNINKFYVNYFWGLFMNNWLYEINRSGNCWMLIIRVAWIHGIASPRSVLTVLLGLRNRWRWWIPLSTNSSGLTYFLAYVLDSCFKFYAIRWTGFLIYYDGRKIDCEYLQRVH